MADGWSKAVDLGDMTAKSATGAKKFITVGASMLIRGHVDHKKDNNKPTQCGGRRKKPTGVVVLEGKNEGNFGSGKKVGATRMGSPSAKK